MNTQTINEQVHDVLGGQPIDAVAEAPRVEELIGIAEWALLSINDPAVKDAEPLLWWLANDLAMSDQVIGRRIGAVFGLTALIRAGHALSDLATELRAKLMWGMPLVFVDQLPRLIELEERRVLRDIAHIYDSDTPYMQRLKIQAQEAILAEIEQRVKDTQRKKRIARLPRCVRERLG